MRPKICSSLPKWLYHSYSMGNLQVIFSQFSPLKIFSHPGQCILLIKVYLSKMSALPYPPPHIITPYWYASIRRSFFLSQTRTENERLCDHANAEMARGCISTGYKLQPEKIALHQSLPPETARWCHMGFEGWGDWLRRRDGGREGRRDVVLWSPGVWTNAKTHPHLHCFPDKSVFIW